MKYQLVLQWPASSFDDYDAMILIEDSLIDGLPGDCEVDGHDVGSGQTNIFILTDTPEKTYRDVEDILRDSDGWTEVKIAYRALDRTEYTVLRPVNSTEFQLL